MKKLFLFLLILPFTFFACGSDDDDNKSAIIGTWVLSSASIKEIDTTDDSIVDDILEEEEYYFGDEYNFTSDGKFYISGRWSGDYIVSSNTLIMKDNEIIDTYNSLKIRGNKMYWTFDRTSDYKNGMKYKGKLKKLIIEYMLIRK